MCVWPEPLPTPPVAARRPFAVEAHGRIRTDDWYWLRERENPEVIKLLEAENNYADQVLAGQSELRSAIFDEIKSRVRETDASAPVRRGEWDYFTRTREGEQYAFHCRRPTDAGLPDPAATPGTGSETVLLDENALAGDSPYFALGGLAMSPDQSMVAYLVDLDGSERYTMRVRNAHTLVDGPDVVTDVYYGLTWAADSRTIFYTRFDDAMRPFQVWRHALGTHASSDVLVFEEPDERFNVGISKTRSGDWLVIGSESKTTSELRILRADDPGGDLTLVEPRTPGLEYGLEHHRSADGSERFFVLHNGDGASNFKLATAPVATPNRAHWVDVVATRDDVRLDDVDAFAHYLVLTERADGLARLSCTSVGADGSLGALTPIAFPEDPVTSWLGSNPMFESSRLRVRWTSLSRPATDADFDCSTGALTEVKRQPVGGGYDPDDYETTRCWVTADDGVNVPVSIVGRKDRSRLAPGPFLLYGYGSYEHSIDPTFSAARLSLLDRGFAFAIAHIRGGGEMGRAWYDDGKLAHKGNTFTDFVTVARRLVDDGWTTPHQLVIRGGSAGGLLMGASTNLAPELFAAVIAEVPFVDVLTTMLDATLPLTVPEYEEWGNPAETIDEYERLLAYSPYDNIAEQPYPAMLVTAGLSDPRVQYWEPAKWVQRLRAVTTGAAPIILRTELDAGHGGPSGRYDAWRDEALVLAFAISAVSPSNPGRD